MNETLESLGIDTKGKRHGQIKTVCPSCSGTRGNPRDQSLSVNLDDGVYKCHHCEWSGKVGMRDWRDQLGAPQAKVYEKPPEPSTTGLTQAGRTFLESRGISAETAQEAGIYDNGKALAIPYVRDGQVVHVKYRSLTEKKFWSTKGTELVFYGLDWCLDAQDVVIVEGELDALSCYEAGITSVLSVPSGAPAEGSDAGRKLDCLDSARDLLSRVGRVVIATDNDGPGHALSAELVRRIGPEKCWRVSWPEGIKDANDALTKMSGDDLIAIIVKAKPIPVEGIYTGHDLLQELEHLYDNGPDTGVGFGYPVLDNHYRVKTGHLSIWTGVPSHGKSTVLDQLLVRLAEKHDWRIAMFSPEQLPLVKHQEELMRQRSGKPFYLGATNRMTKQEMYDTNDWVSERFSFILPESPEVDTIIDLAKVEIYRRGVKGIVINPWNELEHARTKHLSETEYIGETIVKLRRFARLHDVHVWIVAHPTKMRKNDDGSEAIPGLWDISGSSHFRNKADVGVSVWRDLSKDDNVVDIHVIKMRFTDYGKLGAVSFKYDHASRRLAEIGVKK